MRKAMWIVALIIGGYVIARAAAEPFRVNLFDPATYRHDRGGPSLIGALAVHYGPVIPAALVILIVAIRRRSARYADSPKNVT